jgi:RNA polymerase sigma-70 factor (ECF subfamily)
MGRSSFASFQDVVLPHLRSAYGLARWITGDADDAEDVLQEAHLRALRYFHTFRGDDGRRWFLAIVRNAAHAHLRRRIPEPVPVDEEEAAPAEEGPEARMLRNVSVAELERAIAQLPLPFRETLVMREIEELSYRQIAEIAGVPIGTVMSRLSRARRLLREALEERP